MPISGRWSRSGTVCALPGMLAGIGIAACLEPSGGNSSFEPLLNEKNTTTTWMDSCRINVDGLGFVTVTIHTTSSGQGHETLVATVVGEVLQIDPDLIRVIRPDTLACLPSNSPVGSRMAIMLGGAAFHAAQKLKAKIVQDRRASVRLRRGRGASTLAAAVARCRGGKAIELGRTRQHRASQLPPAAGGHGAGAGGHACDAGADRRPNCRKNGRVQMYPCHSFEFHLVLMTIRSRARQAAKSGAT